MELNKTLSVDFRGACAPVWDKSLQNLSKDGGRHGTDLNVDKYYFYLAFENALCKDYVTEKFFDALSNNVVPVVFGGAKYSAFAPKKSFININDFPTIEKAAEYLNHLIQHPDDYLEYFKWKADYEVVDLTKENEDRISPNFPCVLCSYLHRTNDRKVYNDLRGWWEGGAECKGEIRGHYCNRKRENWYGGRQWYSQLLAKENKTFVVELQTIIDEEQR